MSETDGDVGTAVTEEMLEATRSDREGLAWWLDELDQEAVNEGPPISSPPSKTPISDRAFDLIVEFEVSSQQLYTSRYRHPVWPGGASGVTVGIGYDIGYTTKGQLHADWDGAIDPAIVVALERAIGVQGATAKGLAAAMAPSIDIGWDPAIAVHRTKVIPRWVGLAESRLPNMGLLGPDSLGALVSLIYNRGASFDAPGDRYAEMRAIKAHMAAKAFASIPGDLRAMKHLWPTVPGLQSRREREAQLFQRGLDAAATG